MKYIYIYIKQSHFYDNILYLDSVRHLKDFVVSGHAAMLLKCLE